MSAGERKLPKVGSWYRKKGHAWNYLVKVTEVTPADPDDTEPLGYVDYVGMGYAEDGSGSVTGFLNLFQRVVSPPSNKQASMDHFDGELSSAKRSNPMTDEMAKALKAKIERYAVAGYKLSKSKKQKEKQLSYQLSALAQTAEQIWHEDSPDAEERIKVLFGHVSLPSGF